MKTLFCVALVLCGLQIGCSDEDSTESGGAGGTVNVGGSGGTGGVGGAGGSGGAGGN